MKAFLLAAGEGRRLRPLTHTIPKCLVPINGTPLLAIWLQLCRLYGVTEVLINLHHLPQQVLAFVHSHDFGVRVVTAYEEHLLGSAGTVGAHWSFVAGTGDFFIIYADNLTNIDLSAMLRFHRQRHSPFTMGLFHTDTPWEKGIVTLDAQDRVIDFVEKPVQPRSNLANAGIYIANQELCRYLTTDTFLDFGFDVLPRLVGHMYGYCIREYWLDIGTPKTYQQAQSAWRQMTRERGQG